jgi:FkbM family methyltransferase
LLNTRHKIALAKAVHRLVKLYRRGRGLPMSGLITRRGLTWELDLNEGIDFAIFLFGLFEQETVRFCQSRLNPGDVVLDIGANIGAYTLPLASAVAPTGRVYAFEPTAYAFRKLVANLALNPHLESVVDARQALLSDDRADVMPEAIYSGWPLEAGVDVHPNHLGELHSTQGAEALTLDSFLAAAERVDFIKLDVDGNEIPVLRGGLKVLERFHPPILMELTPHVFTPSGFAELVYLVTGSGYHFHRLDGTPLPDQPVELTRMIPRLGSINALAVAENGHS